MGKEPPSPPVVNTLEELGQLLRALAVEEAAEVTFVRRSSGQQLIWFESDGKKHKIIATSLDLIEAQTLAMEMTGLECVAAGTHKGVYASLLGR